MKKASSPLAQKKTRLKRKKLKTGTKIAHKRLKRILRRAESKEFRGFYTVMTEKSRRSCSVLNPSWREPKHNKNSK